MEGDIVGVLLTHDREGKCKLSFSLNGSFAPPFGQAFELDLPADSSLALLTASGEEGQLAVNLGQRLFQVSPPMEEGASAPSGLGEAMQLLPAWKVALPSGVKAWPIFEEASRDSKGKKPLEDKTEVEQLQEGEDNWVELMEGWVQTKMVIGGREIEALKPQPLWAPVDPPKKTQKRKGAKLKVNATFDVEFCEKHSWAFEDNNNLASCQSGPSLLTSAESAKSGIIQWLLKSEEGSEAFEVGVIPAHEVETGDYLNTQGKCGLKNNHSAGGDQKPSWPMYNKYIEVVCDIEKNKVTFKVGEKKDQMQEVKILDLPYKEEIKLAVTGWNETNIRLEPYERRKVGDGESDSDSDADEDEELFATTCGNAVQTNTWHVATLCVDLEQRREMILYLDGEPHLHARDSDMLAPNGPWSINTFEGVVLFGRRRAGKMVEKPWRQGGHLRQMRLDSRPLDISEVWSLQLPKGVWGCRVCNARNAVDARVCWQCHAARQKSAVRPPNDADPRHDGLTVLVADSFRELVLESKEHVLVMIHAPWCEACQKVKPHFYRLAKMLKGSEAIRIAIMNNDENDVNSRLFPEPFIPNVKLFLAGKKGSPLTCNTEKTFEAYVKFIEEHTEVKLADSVEDYYPTYCAAKEVHELIEELREAVMSHDLKLMKMQKPPHNAVAAFLHSYLLDSDFYRSGGAMQAQAAAAEPSFSRQASPPPTPPGAGATATIGAGAGPPPMPTLLREISGASSVAAPLPPGPLPPGPLSLQRASSTPAPPPLRLTRAVSNPVEQNEDPAKLEEELKRSHTSKLLDALAHAEMKKTLPEDPREFLREFFLKEASPQYRHQNFYNARTSASWRRAPLARRLVSAVRILRTMQRWVRRELGRRYGKIAGPRAGQWAEAMVTPMTAAALRSNWRRVEEAICRSVDTRQEGIRLLQVLLERGFQPSGAPFGVSPALLASLAGNLEATQFLFVRGADLHAMGGVRKEQQLMPIDAAAASGFLKIVRFLAENGASTARALHFAAAGGHEDVCSYLLAKGSSPDLRADSGLSAFTVAVLAGQVTLAQTLLPHCSPAMLEEALSKGLCYYVGIPGGSTILHLVAHLGGTREVILGKLIEKCPVLVNRANWAQEIPAEVAPALMRPKLQPRALAAFEALGAAPVESSEGELKELALQEVTGIRTGGDPTGEVCPICLDGHSEDDPLVQLKCGHWFKLTSLAQWRAEGKNGASCPSCRAPLPEPASRAEAGGPTLLEVAALSGDADAVSRLLAAGAGQELKAKGSAITPLMWAHWRDATEAVSTMTATGAQLSNGDLEGLHRLRDMERRHSAKAKKEQPKEKEKEREKDPGPPTGPPGPLERSISGGSAAEAASSEDAEKPDPELLKLMAMDASLLWRHFGRSSHQDAVRLLGSRMARGAAPLVLASHEGLAQKVKEPPPCAADFLAAAQVLLGGMPAAKAATALEAAKLFALRSLASGNATSLLSAMALRLYLGDASPEGLHGMCTAGFQALQSSAPLSAEMERYMPFLNQLESALETLPSQRGTHFVGLNVQTPSGKLVEALNGEKGIGSFYPGGLIVWRGCGTVTADPMLAKEIATNGPGVALVLKIRSVTSRDVSGFSAAPDLGERMFLPRRRFRVAGIFALEDMFLRRGLAMSGGRHLLLESFETPDLSALGAGSALSWEAACGRRAACVVLDEEDQGGGATH